MEGSGRQQMHNINFKNIFIYLYIHLFQFGNENTYTLNGAISTVQGLF